MTDAALDDQCLRGPTKQGEVAGQPLDVDEQPERLQQRRGDVFEGGGEDRGDYLVQQVIDWDALVDLHHFPALSFHQHVDVQGDCVGGVFEQGHYLLGRDIAEGLGILKTIVILIHQVRFYEIAMVFSLLGIWMLGSQLEKALLNFLSEKIETIQ